MREEVPPRGVPGFGKEAPSVCFLSLSAPGSRGHPSSPFSFPSANSRPLLPSKCSTSLTRAKRNRQTCRTLACAQTCTRRRTSPPRYRGVGCLRAGVPSPSSSHGLLSLTHPYLLQSKAAASATREWTEQETLLLLEVIGARKGEFSLKTEVARVPAALVSGQSVISSPVSLFPNACRTCPREQLQARHLGHFINSISSRSATWRFPWDPAESTNTTTQRALKPAALSRMGGVDLQGKWLSKEVVSPPLPPGTGNVQR